MNAIALIMTLVLVLLVTPLAAHAQPTGKVHRIAWVHYGSPPSRPPGRLGGAFRQGLRDLGWVEGQNLVIEERFAEERLARIPDLVHELVARQVEVIVVSSGVLAGHVHHVTRTLPIVVVMF